ncbi:MAG TPA: hypothetical protein ENK91_14070 [Bacteroidetes bacterium]|nr:hypothetical protein [Bacteroidota bacterium]
MKKIFNYSVLFLLLGSIVIVQSCNLDKCHETRKYRVYNPVYMTKAQLRNIKIKEAKPLKNPGKIYVFNQYLLINELYEGVHIFDNSDKSNPANLSFISIPGNVDIAVKDGVLFADNYLDLLSFDISDPKNPKFLDSIANVFAEYKHEYETKGYRVYYEPSNVIEEIDCDDAVSDTWIREDGVLLNSYSGDPRAGSSGSSAGNISVGGSMARFTIAHNRLYAVDNSKLHVFNVESPQNPSYTNDVNIGWGIETIFPVKDKLFIGSNSGMFIFSVSDVDNPSLLSSFRHASSCDPVFVTGDIAYITLRSGTRCQGFTNQLEVVDIKDLLNPELIKTYSMDNPHGLTVLENKMVLCEGDFGAKVLEVENPEKIKTKSKIANKHFYDVIGISTEDIIMVGNDGLYQYSLDGYDLTEISTIPIEK